MVEVPKVEIINHKTPKENVGTKFFDISPGNIILYMPPWQRQPKKK